MSIAQIIEKNSGVIGLLGRILIGGLFVMAGFNKIGDYASTQGYVESLGVPGLLTPVVILTELAGGLAVVIGWQTRIAAFLLAGFCVLTGLMAHLQPADPNQMIHLLKNLAIAGGFLGLMVNGAGSLSLDGRRPSAP